MIIAPPQRLRTTSINEVRNQTGSLLPLKIVVGVSLALASYSALAEDTVFEKDITVVTADNVLVIQDHTGTVYKPTAKKFQNGQEFEYSGLNIDHYAPIVNSQFTIEVRNQSTLTINGPTQGLVYADKNPLTNDYQEGNHMFLINKSKLELLGDVDAVIQLAYHLPDIGANLLYLQDSATATIGAPGASVRMWSIAESPDLISAKIGNSSAVFLSTNNQLVGTMDMMDSKSSDGVSTIDITFSGSDAYWFGDEKTWMNSDWVGTDEYKTWYGENGRDNFHLVFNDGAQWTYIGIQSDRGSADDIQYTIPKRISSIELNGGIVNLFDADVERYWKEIGLWDMIQNEDFHMDVEGKHDYVRIGNLKGDGGIFRMDLNGEDKTQSDMLYIEAGSGTHYFEPYNLNLLEPITPENTLTFALVAPGTSVQFREKQNLFGESLYDYELEIAKEKITAEDLNSEENAYWDKTAQIASTADQKDQAVKVHMDIFEGGDNWFIRRVTLTESAAAVGMTGAGYASYDAAVEMDRHDRRLAEQVRGTEESDNGLWVRVHHGRSGADNQYRWDRTGATVGFDRAITENNRLGAYFTYTQGDTEFLDVRGTGDMKRYELALFDTLTLGAHYFDFVGRFGRVSSDYTVGNEAYSTSGDFDQDYAALSAEYGYHLKDENGVFIEPQMQIQVAYLDGFDYEASRGMQVNADSETSVIGRVGLRAGRDFEGTTAAGTLYARADVYHQFTDGQDALFSDRDGHRLAVNWGDTDTWAGIGVGTSWVWKNRFGLQLDVEKVMGGETDDTWLMSGRLNYLF